MQTVEITTTQNVTIEHQLASSGQRFVAFFLDVVIEFVFLLILGYFFMTIYSTNETGWFIYQYFILVPVIFFYSIVSEVLGNGQSIGKLALGIKIIKLNGEQPTIQDYLIRWVFRLIDVMMSIGALAGLLINSSEKKQRLGDILANTIVIKTQPTNQIALKSILKINTLDNYTPKYLDVKRFTEDEMITIKSVVDRYVKHRNKAHREAVIELIKIVQNKLELKELPKNKIEFLKTVIRDYIVLTR